MFRPESVCRLQMDGMTIERGAQTTALVGVREIELNHVVMQLTSPATLGRVHFVCRTLFFLYPRFKWHLATSEGEFLSARCFFSSRST